MSTKKKKKVTAKPLLQESVVKRWGRIARLSENAGFEQKLEEMYPMAEEEEMEDELGDEMPPMGGEEAPMPEEPMGDEGGMGDEALVNDIVSAVADAISGVTGVEVSVSGAEGAEMGGEPEIGGMEPEMGGGDEMGMGDEMGDEEDPLMELNGFDEKAPKPRKENLPGTPMDGGTVTEGEELEEDGEKLEEADDELSTISTQTRDFSGGTPVPQGSVTEAKKRRSALVNEVVKRVVARLRKATPKKKNS